MPSMQGFWKGVKLHFEFYEEPSAASDRSGSSSGQVSGGMKVIDVPRMNRFQETPHQILQKLIGHFGVPASMR